MVSARVAQREAEARDERALQGQPDDSPLSICEQFHIALERPQVTA